MSDLANTAVLLIRTRAELYRRGAASAHGKQMHQAVDILEAAAVATAQPSAAKLVAWMMKFQFDNEIDYFELDPVAYAWALGGKGIALLPAQNRRGRRRTRPRAA